jgi:putative tryptophan/tyrosine transport system substrate-binding protein
MRDGWEGPSGQFLRDASDRLGISLISMIPNMGTVSEFERVFLAMVGEGADAVLVSGEGEFYAHRQLIVAWSTNHVPLQRLCRSRGTYRLHR